MQAESLYILIGISVALFASTNIDDLFVLLAFFADGTNRPRNVVAGQYIGIGALYAGSFAASFLGLIVPKIYIGLLGLAPIFIGLRKLWQLRHDGQTADIGSAEKRPDTARILSVTTITIANGGDNISIYTIFCNANHL